MKRMASCSLKVLDELKDDQKCVFCRQNFMDELLYGKVYHFEDVITHYFCMLFSSQMEQNGRDEDGILGFLPCDVKKEVSRGNKVQCAYCHHDGATVSCSVKSCKKKFHYPCGIENGSMHQFFAQFRSYCVSHRKVQNVPQYACKLTEKYLCLMCQEEVKPKPSFSTIWAPCCKTAWFHRVCVQRMSVSAGYFFKCPNCNNKDDFRKEMSECGIYIPDQDASWEMEPNAFYELAERYNSCDAETCLCPKGRSHGPTDGIWEIILCILCGSQGIHSKCGKGQLDDLGQWTCPLCSTISHKSTSFVSERIEFEPGPSSPVISEETRPRPSGRRGRPPGRRKRNPGSTGSDNYSTSTKKRKSDDSVSADDECSSNSRLYNNNGQQIEVVKCNTASNNVVEIGGVNVNLRNIVLVDSDDNESDVECNLRSTTRLEKSPTRVKSMTGNSDSNSLVCDTVIDLLDSDDDSHDSSATQLNRITNYNDIINIKHNDVTSTSDTVPEDDGDDVIFVSCDISNTNSTDNDCSSSSALLRFVENNTVYIVSPADVKRKGGLENLTSSLNPCGSTECNHPTRSSSSSTAVWQSIPLHKSIVHSLSTNQINADYSPIINNCSSVQKNSLETKQSISNDPVQSWKSDSEIICID